MSDEMKHHDAEELVPMTDGELVLEMPEMEALALQSLLSANGINAVLNGVATMPNLPFEIHVPAGSLDEAARIYQEARDAGPEAAEAAEAEGERPRESSPDA
ncbi:MAG TPA: hypothetical protein PKJ41_18645 [Bryobacteraceae bacterium]|nr:hypothetical protein [Bryobacteraceae bacterium]HPT27734.1 hypothetical protein [Bryobacteraceae bacterium]